MPFAGLDWGEMINLFYCTDANFGDAMSPMVVAKLSGQEVRSSSMWSADMMAIGSVFYRGDFFMADTYKASIMRRIKAVAWDVCGLLSRPVLVWGSGFLQYPPFKSPHFMRRFKVFALRGLYTRKILERYGLMVHDEQVAYGDPGLLFADLFGIKANPKYDVGIIPHVGDAQKRGWATRLERAFKDTGASIKMIDAVAEPYKVVSEIATCHRIISSSLHGLIVADSLGIPNLHAGLSTLSFSIEDFELKFRDYYSAYGETMPQIISGSDLLSDPKRYVREGSYRKPNRDAIAEVKVKILCAFPRVKR